jgi:hypothetical protein
MRRVISSVLLGMIISLWPVSGQDTLVIPRQELIDDTRELMTYIESIHPDPYLYSGGKVAFNRLFQDILQAIPAEGMDRDSYIKIISPLVASISDGHTRIETNYQFNRLKPGGIPLSFGIVEKIIYVDGVAREEDLSLLGAKLLAVEGVSPERMIDRLGQVEGIENYYHGMMRLRSYLRVEPYLSSLLPEWKDHSAIRAEFEIGGRNREIIFRLPVEISSGFLRNESRIDIPSMENRDFAWHFTSADRETAILKIDNLSTYREMYESISESRSVTEELKVLYQRVNGKTAPSGFEELMAGIPSATDLFREMFTAMKSAGSRNLIIDLSKNGGGNSLMGDILTYFLYGKQALASIISESPPVKKYSPYYYEMKQGKSLEGLNREYARIQSYSLEENDYDFSTERFVSLFKAGRLDTLSGLKLKYKSVPSFLKEIASGRYERYYTPRNVIVTSSTGTYSSAFTVLRYLNRSGAAIAGSVSAQSANGFGNIIGVTLKNSGIKVSISHDSYAAFPGNPFDRGMLEPDYKLTYNDLVKYRFDPNSEILLALDVLKRKAK